MIKRKLTIRPKKISKAQEDAYWENRKRERDEKFVNDFYQENKYKLIPVLIIFTMITYPFIKVKEVYDFCKNKKLDSKKVHPQKENILT